MFAFDDTYIYDPPLPLTCSYVATPFQNLV
jgi:hypothetical protein